MPIFYTQTHHRAHLLALSQHVILMMWCGMPHYRHTTMLLLNYWWAWGVFHFSGFTRSNVRAQSTPNNTTKHAGHFVLVMINCWWKINLLWWNSDNAYLSVKPKAYFPFNLLFYTAFCYSLTQTSDFINISVRIFLTSSSHLASKTNRTAFLQVSPECTTLSWMM